MLTRMTPRNLTNSSLGRSIIVAILAATLLTTLALVVADRANADAGDLDLVSWSDDTCPVDFKLHGVALSSISYDGRLVAYSAGCELPGTPFNFSDIFVRDMTTGETRLASAVDGTVDQPGNGDSWHGQISSNGRYVVFVSSSNDLSSDPVDEGDSLFLRDLQSDTTKLVAASDGEIRFPSVSDDGNRIAYTEDSLVGWERVLVRHMDQDTAVQVNRKTGPTGAIGSGPSFDARISADGTVVAFGSGNNLDDHPSLFFAYALFARNLDTGVTTRLSAANESPGSPPGYTRSVPPSLSSNGNLIAFSGVEIDSSNDSGVAIRDLQNLSATFVPLASAPALSADGGKMTFSSDSPLLAPNDVNNGQDVFVMDLPSGDAALISRATGVGGIPGDLDSALPRISGDGHYVSFQSYAEVLSADDNFGTEDIFRRDLGGGSTPSVTGPTLPGPPRYENQDDPGVPTPPAPRVPDRPALPMRPEGVLAVRDSAKLRRPFTAKLTCFTSQCSPRVRAQLTISARKLSGLKVRIERSSDTQSLTAYISIAPRAKRRVLKALRSQRKVAVKIHAGFAAPGLSDLEISRVVRIRH